MMGAWKHLDERVLTKEMNLCQYSGLIPSKRNCFVVAMVRKWRGAPLPVALQYAPRIRPFSILVFSSRVSIQFLVQFMDHFGQLVQLPFQLRVLGVSAL